MTVKIQFRRGAAATWTANSTVVLSAGEPGFETDTGKFKVGDGTLDWSALPYAAGLESLRLQDLTNVSATAPTNGQVLTWNTAGSTWQPATPSGGSSVVNIDDLLDVNVVGTPSTGQVLKWDGTFWTNGTDATGGGGGSTSELVNGTFTFELDVLGHIKMSADAESNSRMRGTGGSYPWLLAGLGDSGGVELSWVSVDPSADAGDIFDTGISLATTGASSADGSSTLTFATQATAPFSNGDTIIVSGVTPVGFNGTKTVTGCTTGSVTFVGTTAGPQTIAGTVVREGTVLNTLYINQNGLTVRLDANNPSYLNWQFNNDGTTDFPGFTMPATDGTVGQVLTTDGAGNVAWDDLPASGGFTRTTAAGTSGSLADGAVGPINITGFKSYSLFKVQTSAASWVRIYVSEAARLADAARSEGVDPSPGAGVIAEIITTGAETVLISPATLGFNDEAPVTTNIPVRVTNKSGSTAAITVTLTLLQLEA